MSTQFAKNSRKKYRGDRGLIKCLRSSISAQIKDRLSAFVGRPLNTELFFIEHPDSVQLAQEIKTISFTWNFNLDDSAK